MQTPVPSRRTRVLVFSLVMLCVVVPVVPWGRAEAASGAPKPTPTVVLKAIPPPGLQLSVSAPIVDVGTVGVFTLSALFWPAPATATLTFLSPHHGFTGPMVWVKQCSCFRIGVSVASRIHPLETAHATATVRYQSSAFSATRNFMIRGLASNGHNFAPGGPEHLSTWVSEPQPLDGDIQHFCAWLRTTDNLGVPGVRVQFVAHYSGSPRRWYAGLTKSNGVVCNRRSVGKARIGFRVVVDAYAGALHALTSFTPRS